MNKISVIKAATRKKTAKPPVELETMRGRDELGRVRKLYKLDLASEQFGAQFTRAFELSVAAARRENRRPSNRKTLADAAD